MRAGSSRTRRPRGGSRRRSRGSGCAARSWLRSTEETAAARVATMASRSSPMPDKDVVIRRTTATVQQRVDAIQSVFDERGMKTPQTDEELRHMAEEEWAKGGARVV